MSTSIDIVPRFTLDVSRPEVQIVESGLDISNVRSVWKCRRVFSEMKRSASTRFDASSTYSKLTRKNTVSSDNESFRFLNRQYLEKSGAPSRSAFPNTSSSNQFCIRSTTATFAGRFLLTFSRFRSDHFRSTTKYLSTFDISLSVM